MSDISSAGDDDLDLVQSSPSPSQSVSSPFSGDDPYAFFDDGVDQPQLNSEPIDRLSTLPNPTLLHILSFLPTKDAIKTSALSKKFESLWTLTSTLTFCPDPQTRFDIRSFVSSVDQTLILHNSPKLEKFHLKFDYDDLFRSSVNRWISFALRRDVEEIDFDMLGNGAICEFDRSKFFKLPVNLCNYSRLVKLSLSCVRFGDRNREICWSSLKYLSLRYVMLDEALIKDIFSGCRKLEDLELRECSGFNRLEIGSEGLKRLKIYGYGDFCQSDTELEISAPALTSLGIYGSFRRKFKLSNVESLVDCTLNFRLLQKGSVVNTDASCKSGGKRFDGEDYDDLMLVLLSSICHAKNLTLGSHCIEVLSTPSLIGVPLLLSTPALVRVPLLETRYLTLEICFDKCNFRLIRRLMMLSYLLEKLVLNIQSSGASQISSKNFSDSCSFKAENFCSLLDRVTCLQRSLKAVEIKGFSGSQYETEFAQSLLKHGLVLEKMVIVCNKTEHLKSNSGVEEEELLEIVRKILSFKRASAKAVVLFSW